MREFSVLYEGGDVTDGFKVDDVDKLLLLVVEELVQVGTEADDALEQLVLRAAPLALFVAHRLELVNVEVDI